MTNIKLPKIVIVGRPNVGKSSLFNRIAGSRKAIVESASGTTRDRLYADIKWKTKGFTIVDTGGFEKSGRGPMAGLILKQLERAIAEADIIFFVTDGTAGILPQDIEFSTGLRRTSKKIYLIVNKIDNRSQEAKALDFFELGMGEPYAISATGGSGIDKLLDDVAKHIENPAQTNAVERVKVAIIGRPNVGKSSYLNSILNEERAIVHPIAGTTRDATDTDFELNGTNFLLIDTAGIRHNAKINEAADFYGGVRSKEAIARCDVALVLIDGFDGLREDDMRIINLCIDEGKALALVVNKWDLAEGADATRYQEMLIQKLKGLRNYPVIFTSCKTGKNVIKALELAGSVYKKSAAMLTPDELSVMLEMLNNASEIRNKRIKFKYLAQKAVNPPEFVIGVKSADSMAANLKRFVENFLRLTRDFEGVPIRISFERGAKAAPGR